MGAQATGGTWMWAGARPAQAAGAGCLRWQVSTTPASTSSHSLQALVMICASAGRWPVPAPARVAAAEQLCCMNEPIVAQHTVPTVQTAQLL